MNLVYEIQKRFANTPKEGYEEIQLSPEFSFWVYRLAEAYGVAVDLPDPRMDAYEQFATATLDIRNISLAGKSHHFLVLENSSVALANEFAAICADFADPGSDGKRRHELCENPSAWWSKWKSLIGNSAREKTIHSVIGELLVYEYLTSAGADPVWQGPEMKSHDIECSDTDFEVKSTIDRYHTRITVTGEYQLEPTEGKSLKIAFCRFEEVSSGGVSIDMMVDRLSALGVEREILNSKLAKIGFKKGCSAREQRFTLHEKGFRIYNADDSFPKITNKSFKGNKFPSHISRLSYEIDLKSIPFELQEITTR